MRAAAAHLAIFSKAGEGIGPQIKHNVRGHGAFLLGHAYRRAVWFYFPVLVSIKLTAGLLTATLVIAALRPRALVNPASAAAAAIMLFTPIFRVQTGVRMVLPAVALAIVGLAAALTRAHGDPRTTRAGMRAVALVAVGWIGWSAVAAARAWPDGLRFANEFWGGTETAFRLVSDSNYAWGQGVPELRRRVAADHLEALDLWYWGADPAAQSGPWRLVDIRASGAATEADWERRLAGRRLAVSTTLLYGSVLTPETAVGPEDQPALRSAEALRRVLVARAAADRTSTYLLYDFR
jgi:hypothetical protein